MGRFPNNHPSLSSGYRSAMGVMALQVQGFDRVKGFPPGFAAWKAAGAAVDRQTRHVNPAPSAQV
ncbi:hypothetical protein KBY67_02630 [Synechococcus sp. RedBA-s]|nr:hypothetical protein [Synechococcus sp. RedBA-s]